MQELLKYLLITYVAIAVFSLIINFILWRETKSEFYKLLFTYWAIIIFHFSVQGLAVSGSPLIHAVCFMTIYPVMCLVGLLLLKISGIPFRWGPHMKLMALSIPLVCLFHVLRAPPWLLVIPVTVAGSSSAVQICWVIMRERWKESSSILKGLTITVFLSCLHVQTYPFAFTHPELAVPGFAVAMIFILSLMIFTPAAVSEVIAKEKSELELTVRYQMQLTQAAKFSALGEMAGGVAHEINNPLQIIQGLSVMIRKALERTEFNRDELISRTLKIEQTTDRIANITSGLMAFSRDGRGSPMQEEKLQRIIEETTALFRESFLSERIVIELGPIDPDLTVHCRKSDLQQVVLNLLSNSRDAVRNLSEKWIRVDVTQRPGLLTISVIDSGSGLPEAIVDKIFQPFFTTKDIGRGTGLGLSVAQGIVEAHGGRIWYDLHQGHTRFTVELKSAR